MRDTAKPQTSHCEPGCGSRGITLVETVLSLLILGGAFVASLNTIASARGAQAIVSQRQLGLALAEDLMAEVLVQANYKEGVTFGPELGEVLKGRSAFDDIDDYHGWKSAPPIDRNGEAIAGAERYTRQVEVAYVKLWNPASIVLIDQGVVRITVTVTYGNKVVATLTSYRTDSHQAPQEVY